MHLRLLPLFLASAVLAGCGSSTPSSAPAPAGPSSGINPTWRLAGKARVAEGNQAMVVSGSPIASEVGRDILRAGGNAVDAAVAVGFALAVVHPEAGNLGGGGFMVFRMADGTNAALDYREAAPGRSSHDMYLDRAGDPTGLSDKGALAAGVPGSVAGLVEAQHKFGKL
ncbi:MAG TPA: gamma-glutamyltransferase, partial [Gemmatimonadales bacterium]|nr:gamma-glutamyltransferase [Gemmatimonadales bacterium]